jgi:hypothetical protein
MADIHEQWINIELLVLSRSAHNVSEKISGEKDLSCGKTTPDSSIMMCQLMHRY